MARRQPLVTDEADEFDPEAFFRIVDEIPPVGKRNPKADLIAAHLIERVPAGTAVQVVGKPGADPIAKAIERRGRTVVKTSRITPEGRVWFLQVQPAE